MKPLTIILTTCLLTFLSCKRDNNDRVTNCEPPEELPAFVNGPFCTDDVCATYTAIWKEIIMERNNLSQEFFDAHLEIVSTELHSWNDGISFNVCYKFAVEWAEAYECDQFIIKIDADNVMFPALDLPRDQYLTKEEVLLAADNAAFGTYIGKIANTDHLMFASSDEVIKVLTEYVDVSQLCLTDIGISGENGNLYLIGRATFTYKENACVAGTMDLINGAKQMYDGPCWVE